MSLIEVIICILLTGLTVFFAVAVWVIIRHLLQHAVQAKVPIENVCYRVCDLEVGESATISPTYALCIDVSHRCWVDENEPICRPIYGSERAEITRTKTGYAVKLLTPGYKFRVRSCTYGMKPVEKFEISSEPSRE